MINWIANSAPMKCRVAIITIGWFTYGQWNTSKKLEKMAEEVGKKIKFEFLAYDRYKLENRLSKKDSSHVFCQQKNF